MSQIFSIRTYPAHFLLILGTALSIVSCDKDENETLISQHNGTESHKTGEDCMQCHRSGGEGPGIFTVAGSVYYEDLSTPFPNATVEVYATISGSTGLSTAIAVDAKGNFYTTVPLDLSSGYSTHVVGTDFQEYEMDAPITTGACSSCHGISTDRIGVK